MSKKIVYTATFQRSHNYGAMLQCWALLKALKQLGYDAKSIDYTTMKEPIFHGFKWDGSLIEKTLYNIRILLHSGMLVGYQRYEMFYDKWVDHTEQFKTWEELLSFFKKLTGGIVISGSDQVWNCAMNNPHGLSPFYALEFVPENMKKATYAISMGNYEVEKGIEETFAQSMRSFERISVRESFAAKQIFKYNSNIVQHIDPVFLIDRVVWQKHFALKNNYKSYDMCYELYGTEQLSKCFDYVCKKNKENKSVLLTRNMFTEVKANKIVMSAGPLEFLRYVYAADTVVTTSFHGIAFSILFHKKFWACLGGNAPQRIMELLSYFGLENRVVPGNGIPEEQPDIDWTAVDKKIEEFRAEGLKYLAEL